MIEITSRLPSDYQEVEYLESTGTQYIDTGVKGKTGLKASGAIMLTASQTCIALGCYSPQRCYMLNFNSNVPRYGYVDWYTAIAAVTVNEKYNFEVSFEKSAQYLKLNGTTVISSANATIFTNNYNMFAFAYNDGGSAGDFAKCRFYSLNLYDNGTLIREFVPCYRKSNNVAGFYDLLNDAFYTNKGTGSFVVGADVGGTVITSGGVILKKYALRRRMMVSYAPFAFEYTGNYTDNRDADGIGDVTLNTSGQLVTSGKTVRVTVYILGAGGGGAESWYSSTAQNIKKAAPGGGGGNQTVEVELAPGVYEIIIGTGGTISKGAGARTGGTGGNTSAFGYTSTGGKGGYVYYANSHAAGAGGIPNGSAGTYMDEQQGYVGFGGTPNGGSVDTRTNTLQSGGDGLIRITFS